MNKEKKGISISEIIKRLKLSRNYITRNITHCIKHIEEDPSKGTRVFFDEIEFRKYLKNQAIFTRQTKRINIDYEIEEYNKKFPGKNITKKDCREFMGKIPRMSDISRSQLPAIPVPSFDFWDKKLIFPKEYIKDEERNPDTKIHNAEICYRDMFEIGAVKIQLGKQKTMFCVIDDPGVIHPDLKTKIRDSEKYFLVPADWEPFYSGVQKTNTEEKKLSPFEITIKGDSRNINWRDIESALRKSLILDRVEDFGIEDNEFMVKVVGRLGNISKA